MRRDDLVEPHSWGAGSDIGKSADRTGTDRGVLRDEEAYLELAVSRHIRAMPLLWLAIEDPPGPESLRGLIERNSIALLSNYERNQFDPPSQGWLGQHSDRDRVRQSGLWNNNHVEEEHEASFLDNLQRLVDQV
jgi:hypothetical protein